MPTSSPNPNGNTAQAKNAACEMRREACEWLATKQDLRIEEQGDPPMRLGEPGLVLDPTDGVDAVPVSWREYVEKMKIHPWTYADERVTRAVADLSESRQTLARC